MKRSLDQLTSLCNKYNSPLIIAGDLFDKWNSPAELINFTIANLPKTQKVYAIPGQHDLAYHSYSDIKKTSYWTLVEAKAIIDIPWGCPVAIPGEYSIQLHSFPWGHEVGKLQNPSPFAIEVAVIHSYIWAKDACYSGAAENKYFMEYQKLLRNYNVAVFGDNHIPFHIPASSEKKCNIINCGTLMVRKSDDIKTPKIGLLLSDGTVKQHKLDTSKDVYLDKVDRGKEKHDTDFKEFMDELNSLGDAAINFSDAVQRVLSDSDIPNSVKKLILKCMEKDR